MPVCVKVLVHAGYLWQVAQVEGYFTALAVCVAGFCTPWQVEQLEVAACVNTLGFHAEGLWQVSQVVGNFTVFAVWVAGLFARWHEAQPDGLPGCLKPQPVIVSTWQAEQLVP